MKTYLPKVNEIERQWFVVDAAGVPVGRLAAKIADVLRGKNKPIYSTHLDTGDFVVVINAENAHFTGKKSEKKEYWKYTGHMGGYSTTTAKEMRAKNPAYMIEHAVKGMVPKNRLGRQVLSKLRVYAGNEHPHAAQNPVEAKWFKEI
ncbi:MAG: 50S ribosomal protein L13 [Lentisphaeria bacterium]